MCHDIGKHENVALFLEQAIKCDSIYHSQGFANQTDITLWAYLYLMDHYKVINETDKSKDYFHQAWVRDKEITKEYINYLENANKWNHRFFSKIEDNKRISQDLIWQLQVWMMIDTITSSYLLDNKE